MELKLDAKRKQLLDDVFDAFSMLAVGNYVSLYDIKGMATRYSPGAVEIFDLPGEYIPDGAYDWSNYVHPDDRHRYEEVIAALIACETRTYDLTYRVRKKDGTYSYFRYIGAVIRDEAGGPSLVGGMMINEGLLENTDPITILRNKHVFFNDLSEHIRRDRDSVVLMLGFRGLSQINEFHGYSYGNRVLQEVGWLIQEYTGQQGIVYRMDGSRFAFLTDTLSERAVSDLYEMIQRNLRSGIRVDGIRHNLSATGGMISVRGQKANERAVYSCLSYAYNESKERRHGSLVVFDGSVNYTARRSLELLSAIRSSVFNGCEGFSLYYQPIVRSPTGQVIGVEPLLRWYSDLYGQVPPLEFIPILEQDSVFEELWNWVLRQALTDGVQLLERNPDLVMGINISAVQLERESFVERLLALTGKVGFPADRLYLELTEGCRLLELSHLTQVAEALRSAGIRIVIDDFGRGFSSLEMLKALTPEAVKLDRSLVQNLEASEADRAAILNVAELANLYGSTVCVKGVETAGMQEILKEYPIRSMQGYFFSAPVPFEALLERHFA